MKEDWRASSSNTTAATRLRCGCVSAVRSRKRKKAEFGGSERAVKVVGKAEVSRQKGWINDLVVMMMTMMMIEKRIRDGDCAVM